MTPLSAATLIGAAVFVAGLVGLFLQRVLHESFTTGGARDMIGAVAGLLTLLSALVLGLLVWTAFGVYSGQNLAIQGLAAKVLQLDLALAEYGPDAAPLREKLKASVDQTIAELQQAEQTDSVFVARNLDGALRNLHARDLAIRTLHPQTDEQKAALSSATSTIEGIAQQRVQMALALANPISYPLIFTVAGWVTAIFLGYGLTAKGHTMSVIAAIVGALAVASAFFLILDMSVPYEGTFHVSAAPLKDVRALMNR